VQLVDARTGTPGNRFVAHRGSSSVDGRFNHNVQPFLAQVAWSPDGRRVSSVASHALDGAIATFDVAAGTPVGASRVGSREAVLGVSPDLQQLVIAGRSAGAGLQARSAELIDASTGARLAEIPVSISASTTRIGGKPMTAAPILLAPVALAPRRPDIVYQSGAGALSVADWTQLGAPHFARAPRLQRLGPNVALSPVGSVLDLDEPLRQLGLGPADDPTRPWNTAVSARGSVAILSNAGIAIWNPSTQRIERRLTGLPPSCAGASFDFERMAFAGTAREGRLVLGCPPKLLSWDLSSRRTKPAWEQPWSGPRFDTPVGPAVSEDGDTVTISVLRGDIRILDGATGRERAAGPAVTYDQIVRVALSTDGRIAAAMHWSGDLELIDTTDGSVVQVLKSSDGVVQPGVGETPAIGLSRDGTYVAAWHDQNGLEVWNARTGESVGNIDGRVTAPFATLVPNADPSDADGALDRAVAVSVHPRGDAVTVSDLRGLTRAAGAPERYHGLRRATWSLRSEDWVRAACTIVGHDLSRAKWNDLIGSSIPYHKTCTTVRPSPKR
jgi:hypothetical protein